MITRPMATGRSRLVAELTATACALGAAAQTPSRTSAGSSKPRWHCWRIIRLPASGRSPPPPGSRGPLVYRHFSSRNQLLDTARRHALDAAAISAAQATATAPETTDDAGEVGVAELLNRVPAHLVGDQIVAEARRLPGVSSVALYLVDIDGSRLCRFAGSPEFPAELDAPLAVGPEIPRDGIANQRRVVAEQLPGSIAAPLYLRGRAIGLLLAVGAEQTTLDSLAREAATAVYLAESYTDVIALSRRRKPISAAGEMQQNLLPPRVMQISGAALRATCCPAMTSAVTGLTTQRTQTDPGSPSPTRPAKAPGRPASERSLSAPLEPPDAAGLISSKPPARSIKPSLR